ncbi:probable LRR receptor-like serine/threonine-protein kinase At3g47570 [Rutidosis leptorrhynchoides]|uniref:probable LRR receptor-like serine/threonine-protein kinase At3g47570 n=1 Tax=Rutidosis leptorrhynchoides TaxID=125765 RepID=UPI003A98F654
MRGLVEFDLSHNNLSGQISRYLEEFPLYALNLSFNDFGGEVPVKGVFANASGISVVGNMKLCGGSREVRLPKCKNKENNKSKATDGFSEANLIGKGGTSSVYKGVFEHDDRFVAVKILHLHIRGAHKNFTRECEAWRSTRHRNLLKIITSCSSVDFQDNDFKALVYEFMPNESLHDWLHSSPSNILLDDDMVAHVGDFGLVRFLGTNSDQNSSFGLKGIIGYAPPAEVLALLYAHS